MYVSGGAAAVELLASVACDLVDVSALAKLCVSDKAVGVFAFQFYLCFGE